LFSNCYVMFMSAKRNYTILQYSILCIFKLRQ